MGAGAPTVLSDWFMHADACKPQPGCGWCRGAMRAQMRRLSGCADSKEAALGPHAAREAMRR